MPKISLRSKVHITPRQFIEACDLKDLQELEQMVRSKTFAQAKYNLMHQAEKQGHATA